MGSVDPSTARPGIPAADPALVAVVIVNYNAGNCLEAVRALEQQTYRDFQVIVVDNASTDGSIAALCANAPQIQIVQAERNLGFAAANNLAVRRAPAARWIALLNPRRPSRTRLARRTDASRAGASDCASIASRTLDARDASVLDGAGDAYHTERTALAPRVRLRRGGCLFEAVEEVFSASGAAALYARAAWDEVGVDERFFCYAEDVD